MKQSQLLVRTCIFSGNTFAMWTPQNTLVNTYCFPITTQVPPSSEPQLPLPPALEKVGETGQCNLPKSDSERPSRPPVLLSFSQWLLSLLWEIYCSTEFCDLQLYLKFCPDLVSCHDGPWLFCCQRMPIYIPGVSLDYFYQYGLPE